MRMNFRPLISSLMNGLLVFSLLVSPFAQAQAQLVSSMSRVQYFGKGFGVLSAESLKAAGVQEVKTLAGPKEMSLLFLGKNGDILRQFVWQRTAPKNLEHFRPSKLRQWTSTLRSNAGGIMGSKFKHFPFEAMSFFSAIGAINMYDLVFHYQDNPLVMSQFLSGQTDPVTHVGFLAFMAMNGLTAEPLQEVIRSRRLNYFIPYFGMSMGMMASNIVHDVAQSKVLRACARSLGKNDPKSDELCDQAWDEMNRGWDDKWGQYATSWLSMMGSTLLGGAADWARTAATRKALQFVGLEIAFSVGTTGGTATAARFVWTTVKNLQFLALDFWLRKPIENLWMNAFGKGPQLGKSAQCLGVMRDQLINTDPSRQAAWELLRSKACSTQGLNANLQEFSKLSQEWRIENLKEVLASHQSWQLYLANFASHYRSARSFYQQLTDQIWRKTYSTQAGQKSSLDQINPLFGIYPADANTEDWSLYLQDMSALIPEQQENLRRAVTRLQQWTLNSGEFKNLSVFEKRHFQTWLQNLSSENPQRMRRALDELNLILPNPAPELRLNPIPVNEIFSYSESYRQIMQVVAAEIGRPQFTPYPGQSFLNAWAKIQGRDFDDIKEGKVQAFPRQYKNMATLSIPEYLIAAMAFGPDLEGGESVIDRNRWSGAPAVFNPPRILTPGDLIQKDILQLRPDQMSFESIFTSRARHEKCDSLKAQCEQPVWNWIRAGWIRPEVMDRGGNHIAQWWESKVEPSYMDAWYDFEVTYEGIIQDLAQHLFAEDSQIKIPWTNIPIWQTTTDGYNWANSSGFSNAALPQLRQERQVYLLFLNDLLNPKPSPMNAGQATVANPIQKSAATLSAAEMHPSIASYIQAWDQTMDLFPKMNLPLDGQMDTKSGTLISRVSNTEIEKSIQNMEARLQDIGEALKNAGSGNEVNPQWNETQNALLGLLKGLHQEILDYGLILNTASYAENHNSDGQVSRRRCKQLPSATGSSQFRGQLPGCP